MNFVEPTRPLSVSQSSIGGPWFVVRLICGSVQFTARCIQFFVEHLLDDPGADVVSRALRVRHNLYTELAIDNGSL